MSTFSRVANLTPAAFLRHQRRRLHRSTQRIGGKVRDFFATGAPTVALLRRRHANVQNELARLVGQHQQQTGRLRDADAMVTWLLEKGFDIKVYTGRYQVHEDHAFLSVEYFTASPAIDQLVCELKETKRGVSEMIVDTRDYRRSSYERRRDLIHYLSETLALHIATHLEEGAGNTAGAESMQRELQRRKERPRY